MTENSLVQGDVSLSVNTRDGTLSIQLGQIVLSGICYAELSSGSGGVLRTQGRQIEAIDHGPVSDLHGQGERIAVRYAAGERGVAVLLEACIYEAEPYVALRVDIENRTGEPLPVIALSPLATVQLDFGDGPLDGWVNGFHSWGFSGFVPHTHRQPRIAGGPLLRPQGHNPTTELPRRPGQYASEEICALIDKGRQAMIAGFIGVTDQFGQVYADGRPGHKSLSLVTTADGVPLRPGETIWGEWAILYRVDLPHPDPLGLYVEAATQLVPGRGIGTPPQPGWSSWYQFFDHVTADDMKRNQRTLLQLQGQLPLKLIQLDDGYQPHWGDWLDHDDKFPQGVAQWAEDVCRDGFEPGLWLSPFTVDRKSHLFQTQPDAVIQNARGHPVYGGFVPMRRLWGLDPTHPATRDFVSQTIDTMVHKWNIHYLKLDFLYCGALPGPRYDRTRTRAQSLRDGLKLIREVAGEDTLILGCGCPFGPALGLVDIMRVSPDVAPSWYPRLYGITRPFRNDFNLPAARNSIAVTINHAWMHRRWWWLDADNLLVREQQNMDAAEVQTLVSVEGILGSHCILSDDLAGLPEERTRWAASLLPVIAGQVNTSSTFEETLPGRLVRQINGLAGVITLLALINWSDDPAPFSVKTSGLGLPAATSTVVFDFWKRRVSISQGDVLHVEPVPAHGVAYLALQPDPPGIGYLGTDLHICPGSEIAEWQAGDDELKFRICLGRKASGTVWLKLPHSPAGATCDGQPVSIAPESEPGVYKVRVEIDGEAQVRVRLK